MSLLERYLFFGDNRIHVAHFRDLSLCSISPFVRMNIRVKTMTQPIHHFNSPNKFPIKLRAPEYFLI